MFFMQYFHNIQATWICHAIRTVISSSFKAIPIAGLAHLTHVNQNFPSFHSPIPVSALTSDGCTVQMSNPDTTIMKLNVVFPGNLYSVQQLFLC